MHDAAIKDIGNALMGLRRAFDKHDIAAPDVLSFISLLRARDARNRILSDAAFFAAMDGARVTYGAPARQVDIAGFALVFDSPHAADMRKGATHSKCETCKANES